MDLARIQPIVLTGGRSVRFGRDKLREPIGTAGVWLVDIPVAALRAVFGPRVAAVGACDPEVAHRADATIPDRYPGLGPVGGILSAMEATGTDVFVLSGDLAAISSRSIEPILAAASSSPSTFAALAHTDRTEPCIGLYRAAASPLLRAAMLARTPLWRAIPEAQRMAVPIEAAEARNINTSTDLETP